MNAKEYLWGSMVGVELFFVLQKAMPQFNLNTKIQMTNYYTVYINLASDPVPVSNPSYKVKSDGFKSRIFRSVGELLDNPKLRDRGYHYEIASPVFSSITRSIEMTEYGINRWNETQIIYCGYDALNDVLYVKDYFVRDNFRNKYNSGYQQAPEGEGDQVPDDGSL